MSHLEHRVEKTKDGVLIFKDNFDDQAVWFAVYKDADMCGIARILFNFKEDHILETAHYIPNEILWENRPLKDLLKQRNMSEIQRIYVKPDHRKNGLHFLLYCCLYRAAYLANASGIFIVSAFDHGQSEPSFIRWDFDYGDNIKLNFFYLHPSSIPLCLNYYNKKAGRLNK